MLHANTDFIKSESTENIASDFGNSYSSSNLTNRSDNVLINKEHHRPCLCQYCLKGIEKYLDGKKIHLCPFKGCGKIYFKREDVCFHLPVHTGVMSYVCPVLTCSEKLQSREDFIRHERIRKNIVNRQHLCTSGLIKCLFVYISTTTLSQSLV